MHTLLIYLAHIHYIIAYIILAAPLHVVVAVVVLVVVDRRMVRRDTVRPFHQALGTLRGWPAFDDTSWQLRAESYQRQVQYRLTLSRMAMPMAM